MNPRRLFVASCIALVASAFSFVTREDILPALGSTFDLNQHDRGRSPAGPFGGWRFRCSLAPRSATPWHETDARLAFLCHLAGSALTVGSPYVVPSGTHGFAFYVLWAAMFLVGSANGFVEIGINPLTATLYPRRRPTGSTSCTPGGPAACSSGASWLRS